LTELTLPRLSCIENVQCSSIALMCSRDKECAMQIPIRHDREFVAEETLSRLRNCATVFAVLLVALIWAVQLGAQAAAPADIVYARPGHLVDAGGFRLNLYCMGSGSPTVVFDSGWGDWAPAWSKVQPEIAKWTRVCSYDRAGTGFSDPGPMPRTSVHIAEELRTALRHDGIGGPYILVGSAFGGDNVRTFADLYMDEVAGLVLD